MRILLAEDEKRVSSFIQRGLKEEGFVVDAVADGEKALEFAELNPYELIILDIMLPKQDGLTICRELRNKKIDSPILMLTARSSTKDKVLGLNSGADDYLGKPFEFEEFIARVRALTRRKSTSKQICYQVDDLVVDPLTHSVKRDGQEIQLTAKEYTLLVYLMQNANQVVTRTMISEHVWNESFDSFTNVIDVYMNYLRKKIDTGFKTVLIHTIRGAGYMLKGSAN